MAESDNSGVKNNSVDSPSAGSTGSPQGGSFGSAQDKSGHAAEKPEKGDKKGLKTEPLWLSVSETANVSGVKTKTIRRAIAAKSVRYKVINNRYFIEFGTVLSYLKETTKLANKLYQFGIGQYVEKWKK